MKMLPAHYDHLKAAFKLALADKGISMNEAIEEYESKLIGKDHQMRCRWDILWYSKKHLSHDFVCGQLYKYLNDNHIDSALRKIVKELSAV